MARSRIQRNRTVIIVSFLVIAIVVAAIIAIVVTLQNYESDDVHPPTESPPSSPSVAELQRIDCVPEVKGGVLELTQDICEDRGCIYQESSFSSIPACFYPQAGYGYRLISQQNTNLGIQLTLVREGSFPFGGGIEIIVFRIEERDNHLLRFVIDDATDGGRYKVPVPISMPDSKASNPMYEVNIINEFPFSFQIIRRSTGTVLWDTGVGGFVFSDQFIQISTKLPSKNVYGFGENLHKTFRHDMDHKTWPMFSRDQPPKWKEQGNLYGVHPFYECVEEDGNTHGVFLLNSNAQDYSFTPAPMLTYRTIGGILDFYFFLGPRPEDVTKQYTQMIGRPVMPPYWALGFQLCRYGYTNLTHIQEAVQRTRDADIPHDVQYADIDHMDEQKDFTLDMVNFAGLPDYFRQLQAGGMKTIIILDPTLISNVTDYEPYERMKVADANIKWPENWPHIPANSSDINGALLGYVWPYGKVVFPDFFKESTNQIWEDLIINHHSTVPFDGLWIDMNEPANFGTNEERPWNWPPEDKPYWSLKCLNNKWDEPPYRTMAAFVHDNPDTMRKIPLADKTICMNAVQGEGGQTYKHYDVHSLYGWSQAESTWRAAKAVTGKRSIVISRSTFPGSGKYSGHWLGDNDSAWPDLAHSIIGMLEFNLFGIPYIGADICGFWGSTTVEMCKRWMQLGAFYTFSRNHNGKGYNDQDPGYLGDEVIRASREAIRTRYWLLPYLYTLFHNAHVHGDTVIRPLHHEFPTDSMALKIDRQFLWGPALLISPILEEGQTEVPIYLPSARWYNFYTGNQESTEQAGILNLAVGPNDKIPLHVRGGYILPMQEPANNTYFSRMKNLTLLVALNHDGVANGEMMWDDGEEINTYETGNNFYTQFYARENTVEMSIKWRQNVPEIDRLLIDQLLVYGLDEEVSYIYINEDNIPHNDFLYNHTTKMLSIIKLGLPLSKDFKLVWTTGRRVVPEEAMRVDCLPDYTDIDQRLAARDVCLSRGCVWQDSTSDIREVPPCYFNSSGYGYMYTDQMALPNGVLYNLTRIGTRSAFGSDFQKIYLRVEMHSDEMLRFTFDTDEGSEPRFKVPLDLYLPVMKTVYQRYVFEVYNDLPFSFKIIRRSSKTVLWDTGVGGLTFADQFLQIATKLPSMNIYGFGENPHKSFRHNTFFTRWGMFSRDQPPGWGDNLNLYGVHPFYMCMEEDGNSHGVLLLNSNAQDYSFSPLPMLTYRTIGGILDFFMFMGPHPENVVQQYTKLIGRPLMPPYWSLGFQLCRYGYNSLEKLKAAVDRTRVAGVPHDVQYADIDHMHEQKDFTLDKVNFGGLNDYFKSLQADGMKIIIILDPALISNQTNYLPYDKLLAVDGNIKWPALDENGNAYTPPADSSDTKGALLGYVWPKGKTVFPDFFKNVTKEVWKKLIVDHRANNLTFDGMWIDMNEPANFGTNENRPWNWPEDELPHWSLKCVSNKWDNPPYKTMNTFTHNNNDRNATLPDKTICLNAVQGEDGRYRQYDVHSLYGWSQAKPTSDAMQAATGKRSIVISRSTFPGSGKYVGHWLGDNDSKWPHLAESIVGILEFNLFGIPYIGADICGYFGDTIPELCKRWMQLGAFYTFSRNHNGFGVRDQDPGAFDAEVQEVSRVAMETRYWLLPYLYTLFHYAHVEGNTVIRPLHHEFIWDKTSYGIDRQFLWGPALLISPILDQGQTELSLYLPIKSRWYDFYTGQIASEWGGHSVRLSIQPNTRIPLHLRGGYILPMQEPANNTHFSRMKLFTVRVALNAWSSQGGSAEGELFWDDGESIDTMSNFFFTKFFASEMSVEMKVQHNSSLVDNLVIDNVEVYGVDNHVNNVYLKWKMPGMMMKHMMMKHNNFTYDGEKKVLKVMGLAHALNKDFSLEWWSSDMPGDAALRIDCLPDNASIEDYQAECLRRDCIWRTDSTAQKVPVCFIDTTKYGYRMENVTEKNANNLEFDLRKANPGYSMFGGDRHVVTLNVEMLNDNLIRLKFTDPSHSRYEVPVPLNRPIPSTTDPLYQLSYTSNAQGIFSVQISRKSTGTVLFDTSIGGLTFSSQFLQLATKLPSHNVYGFGEHRHFSFRHNMYYKEWPMFARDQGVGHNAYGNLYGVHPFFTCLEDDQGNSFGVFLFNSNAQEVSLLPAPAVNYRTIGGILDFYIFLGPEPETVIQQYTQLIGRPYFPPYWSLGFQLCRYGYDHIDNMKAAYTRTIEAGIPFDIQYGDIDHMDERMDFTYDQVNFAGLPDFVQDIQQNGMKFIIILDPALISNVTGYQPYEMGKQRDVFIKWPPGLSPDYAEYIDNNMLGYVWPKGKTVFPDFLNNVTHTYWKELIVDWHQTLHFDGLWIDMNEPANFGTNEERPFNWPEKDKPYWSLKCAENQWDNPPYIPRSITGGKLSTHTICMVGVQTDGVREYRHYDVHSLYGWSETKPTLTGLRQATTKRGIVISRSTFPGSGQDGGHWLGDNDSQWPHMKDSIVGMLEFNLFGIPYIGADICGFGGDTTKEMCERWMQVGAFYPFSRNHNAIGQKEQDPAVLGPEVADSSLRAMWIRYQLLPYLYTLFYRAHTTGSTVVRSLMHEFPQDPNTWDIDTQFLWGADFMIAPIVYEAKLSRTVYFPDAVWYDYYTLERIHALAQYRTVDAPRDHIPLYIRGGAILPIQEPHNNTAHSRMNPMGLLVSPDDANSARGELFWDDGDTIDTIKNGQHYRATFEFTNNILSSTIVQANNVVQNLNFDTIEIMGVNSEPASITNNGTVHVDFQYYTASKALIIRNLGAPLNTALNLRLHFS